MRHHDDCWILVEREAAEHGGPRERFDSVYTWGPTGLIARRGVSGRNGHWDPDTGEACSPPPGRTGAYVDENPNTMCDYTYMSDHMGNIVGLVDCENETGHRQVFDAFGNVIGDFVLLHCAADHDWTDIPCHLATMGLWAPPVCPKPPAQPIARMQTGGFNWRGNEGSVTDRVTEDMVDSETFDLRWSAYERPSTGFVYMQARYYEPATGRFLTADPVPYGIETVLTGQNNRWVYCANDPVNCSDPSGQSYQLLIIVVIVLIVALLWGLFSWAGGGSFWAGFLGGLIAGIGMFLGPWGIFFGMGLGSFVTAYLNGNRGSDLCFLTGAGFAFGAFGAGAGWAAGGGSSGMAIEALMGYISSVILGFLQWLGS